ncbi:hypothetical protein PWT90_07807 [Aphanocladium album]|nr:hypothetical protein PWT90_07807 [Aphanocladium album]
MSQPPHCFVELQGASQFRKDAIVELLTSPIQQSRPADPDLRAHRPNLVVHSFGLPEASKSYSAHCEAALKTYFQSTAQGSDDLASTWDVTDPGAPRARAGVRLDPGVALHSQEGYSMVVLPVFEETQQISLQVPGTPGCGPGTTLVNEEWPATAALCLGGSGLYLIKGSLRFICLLYETKKAGPRVARITQSRCAMSSNA